MCSDHSAAHPLHAQPACLRWPAATEHWGDVSADQADGFAPVDDAEPPGPDPDLDDRGYGHGV